jgi:hypothetical protein
MIAENIDGVGLGGSSGNFPRHPAQRVSQLVPVKAQFGVPVLQFGRAFVAAQPICPQRKMGIERHDMGIARLVGVQEVECRAYGRCIADPFEAAGYTLLARFLAGDQVGVEQRVGKPDRRIAAERL